MNVCPSCSGQFADCEGPVHRYMLSSSGCWKTYGQVLAKEYSSVRYWSNHRLTVDAYAAQHPGETSRQAVQSVGLHLMSLFLILEAKLEQGFVTQNMQAFTALEFKWLSPPPDMGPITVADVGKVKSSEEHALIVHEWAHSVWQSWVSHHQTIRGWADQSGLLSK